MTIFKRNLIIATGIYLLFYLTPILANPFMALNLLEAALVGILIFGGFPIAFNIIINKYLAILILLFVLIFIIILAKKMDNSVIVILLFAPSIIQGLFMRLSYKAMLFYVANPNFNLYLIAAIFIGYYIYNNRK